MFRFLETMLLLTIMCVIPAIGCDAILPTHQMVHLQVIRSDSGSPVSGAVVTAAPERERDADMSREEYLSGFINENLNTATTDSSGEARLRINTTIIRGGIFDRRDPLADRVAGEEYLVKVETTPEWETIAGMLRRGETISGREFSVTIKAIGAPTPDEP